jgi:lateral signaling target protein 2
MINTTVEEEILIDTKRKDSDLFEFRPSDSDVIQQENNAGSNQSIYSTAEEVNPETEDSVFDDRNGSTDGRSSSLGNEERDEIINRTNGNGINHMGRSVSLGDSPIEHHDAMVEDDNGLTFKTTKSNGSLSRSRSTGGSPINARTTNLASPESNECIISNDVPQLPSTTPAATVTVSTNHRRNNSSHVEKPPRWVPDCEAPRCMACAALFNPFRRRHHCRNCGGVFCSVCSSLSAPLPKYGLVKAVRVCRECYVRNVNVQHQN